MDLILVVQNQRGVQKYEYIMRFDDDSKVINTWFNVFDKMRRKRAVYFANNIDIDEEKSQPGTMKFKQVTIDQTYGIFKYRWGDSILRYITIALFAKEQQVLHRSQYNLSYCHKC
ncbi:unnamed protein product [Adineta steineri]|uniref:Uncharacterized protein n=1 Tax=Adineta steineri TaxID=433720 RepID=A0A818TZE9_9BILA|nr:unnamed protein product [Adineta steineri]CAF3694174.1 unnamed protein product [Adineta steineri]